MTNVVRVPTDPARRLRAARVPAVALALIAGSALLLTGCSNAGTSLAKQACAHVDTSIHLYTEAEDTKTAAAARAKVERAASQLNQAVQLAAQANSADPAFNPLMTTLQEIGRTSEANLIPALRAQCEAADNPTATAQSPVTAPPTSGTSPSGQGGSG
ncbi:MAG: hypothetical protein M0Z46_09920 [Actinomycetota bacterium]|nr:hypothetical protein [Actinomycetota bacterium]